MRHRIQLMLVFIAFIAFAFPAKAQRVAVKTNVLEWATLTPNLGFEARLSRRLTLDVAMTANPIDLTVADYRLNNITLQPGLRYWFNRPMARHFASVSLLGGMYDLQMKDRRYKGDVLGAGLSYGYALVLSRHWNVEFEAGIGVGHLQGYYWRKDGEKSENPNFNKWTVMPIRLGVTFSYVIK